MTDLHTRFDGLGLAQYANILADIDFEVLPELDNQDLGNLGCRSGTAKSS